MVKKPLKGNGTSRLRFIMIEAEMPEGDLTQITMAIQNALRPSSVTSPRVPKPPVQLIGVDEQDDEDVAEGADEGEDSAPNEVPVRPTAPKPRKPVKRKVVEIDLDSEVSLASFVAKYPPKTEQDRYLVAVAFICEHRKEIEGATTDHVYTCFRKMNWSSGTKDFQKPLRNLKVSQLLEQGKSKGTYAVNHIGLDRVHKLAGD